MATFVITFLLMVFLVAIMAVGVIFQNKPRWIQQFRPMGRCANEDGIVESVVLEWG